MVTGDRIQTLPTSEVRWERRILSPEQMDVKLTLAPRAHQLLDLRNSTVEAKTALVVSDGDVVLGAGPIWEREYDDTTGRWSGTAEGIWALLEHAHVLPESVTTLPLLVASGDDEGEPNPAVATTFTASTWPEIVQGLLAQRAARPGGALPLVFGPAGTGAHDKSYEASAFKTIGEALTDLTRLVDGPELEFTPQIVDNKLRWLVRVGDDAQPEIQSITRHLFDFTPRKRSVRALRVRSSGRGLASEMWGTGGRQAAKALFSRAWSPQLIDAGFPRMEAVSSSHSTVVEQETLDRYTLRDLAQASAPVEWWSWEFHADRRPRLTDVSVGDLCTVRLKGNRYLPDGEYERRIVAMSGTSKSRWVRVTTDEVVTW
ncbi:MAG: hypothetical protein D3X82_16915 [Candidatus Leucobacter sulfamidivorax]|nr:hypothetical protein [Candidatus Leucobacter sulfamidivorax]